MNSKLIIVISALGVIHSPALWCREYMATPKEATEATVRDSEDRVIATVKSGEKFMVVNPHEETQSCTVFLKSGMTGGMDLSQIRELPNEPLMKLNYEPVKQEWQKARSLPVNDEAGMEAREHGVAYYKTLVQASAGDLAAMSKLFALSEFMDGGAGEGYSAHMWELLHLAGDEKFAKAVSRQPSETRNRLKDAVTSEAVCPLTDPKPYLKRHFQKTARLFF